MISQITEMSQLLDIANIQRLGLIYSSALDNGRRDLLASIFTEDAQLIRPAGRSNGREEICGLIDLLKSKYDVTLHKMHNHLVDLDGDTARGEIFCTAEHVATDYGGGKSAYVMSIRYFDRYVRSSGGWLISQREINVEWTEMRQTNFSAFDGKRMVSPFAAS